MRVRSRLNAVVGMTAVLALAIVSPGLANPAKTSAFGFDAPLEDTSLETAALQLAIDWKVPVPAARARMSRQMPLLKWAETAATAGGSDWGGAWFDQGRDGTFVAQASSDAAVTALQNAVPDALSPYIRVAKVQYSLKALREQMDSIKSILGAAGIPIINLSANIETDSLEISTLPDEELIQAGIDPVLVVDAVNKLIGRYPITTFERESRPTPDSCLTSYRVCSAPLRGGVEITDDNNTDGPTCSSGFLVKSNVGTHKPYLLTAGHCLSETGGQNVGWSAAKTSSQTTLAYIGIAYSFSFDSTGDDFGIIRVDNAASWPTPAHTTVLVTASSQSVNGVLYTTTRNEDYPISSVGSFNDIRNSYVCKTGMTTGTTCGDAVDVNSVTGQARVHITSCSGDSGGPYFIGGVGYGLHVSHNPHVNFQDHSYWTYGLTATQDCYSAVTQGNTGYSYYQSLYEALSDSNVNIF